MSVDPLVNHFPYYSPYLYAGNKPIWSSDLNGAEDFLLNFPKWLEFPESFIELPKAPTIPVPVSPHPPLPPVLPNGLSSPQAPTLPPSMTVPLPPGSPMKPTIGTQNLPRTPTGDIDWESVGQGIDVTDTRTWPEPPFAGTWKEVNPPTGTRSAQKANKLGQKRLQNENGDIIRPHLPDKYHPKWHWDLKKGGNINNPWENYTPDGIKIPDGSIYGKDFNPVPVFYNPVSTEETLKRLKQFSDDQEYQKKLEEYDKKMKEFNKKLEEYRKKRMKQYSDGIKPPIS